MRNAGKRREVDRANLRGANLDGANLKLANLTRADIAGASMAKADLSGANFRGVKGLSAAQFATACGDAKTRLPGSLRVAFCTKK